MLYNLAIVIYDFFVHLAAPFSRKPRKMMKGHWVVYELLRQQVEKGEQYIWFHAASLGEFEQGRKIFHKDGTATEFNRFSQFASFSSSSAPSVTAPFRAELSANPAETVVEGPFSKDVILKITYN